MDSKYSHVQTAEVDTSYEGAGWYDRAPASKRRVLLPSGWKATVKLGFLTAVGVFIVNLALLVWTLAGSHQSGDGITTVYTGSCTVVRNVGTWSHLGINIMSSLLLAASNSCMQCLSAPTRSEIDEAHSKRHWLDVGVHTLRNFGGMPALRRWLWTLLALSSVPLHLLYNSILVEAKSSNDYDAVTVAQNFLDRGYWNTTRSQCFNTAYTNINPTVQYLQDNQNQLVRLENADCIAAYSQNPLSLYANVLVVTKGTSNDSILNLVLVDGMSVSPDAWICGGTPTCDVSAVNPSSWGVPGTTTENILADDPYSFETGFCAAVTDQTFDVDYCLAQPTPEICSVGVAVPILVAVLISNAVKAVCFYWTFSRVDFQPLVTIGDAIASFLERPDPTTKGYGALEVTDTAWAKRRGPSYAPWRGSSRIGFRAASVGRWIASSLLFITFWGACLGLLMIGLGQLRDANLSTGFSELVSQGLGRLNSSAHVDELDQIGLVGMVVVANLPQLIISLLYLLYNDLFTRIILGLEWSSYAKAPRALRVSQPRGHQKESYFLSLPWKYAVPLLGAMMGLHWLVSQSIFLAYILGAYYSTYSGGGPVGTRVAFLGLGWSPFALVLSLLVGGVLVVVLWLSGFLFRYRGNMPLVRSSTAAISAACHPAPWDADAASKLVQYGVLEGKMEIGLECVGFSSGAVGPLVRGERYA